MQRIGTFRSAPHLGSRCLRRGKSMIINLMCIGVILIGMALVASHYITEA